MHGEYGADIFIEFDVFILDSHQRRYQAALPVVTVDDVGYKIDIGQCLKHGAAEIGEALALLIAVAVDRIARKIKLIVNKIIRYAVVFELLYAAILVPPAEINVKAEHMAHFRRPDFGNITIFGQYHARVDAPLFQLNGQRAHHVAKPAGLYERVALGCYKQHFHSPHPF
ncbi:hypothetical protein SDC9_183944 [bioreactor metagenome]|uniref:Uncharacterized protein n=1 Tax=bioreactor metagenome TaxID=1076179 RepID=A0A645HBN5_9ZZZZ